MKGMTIKHLMIVCLLLLGSITPHASMSDDLIAPSPDLEPQEVVEIQLLGLKLSKGRADSLEMAQVWRFAHPDNKRITGPIQRFAMLFALPAYRPLLGHSDYQITLIDRTDDRAQLRVRITADDGKAYLYDWVVGRATQGIDDGSFMTLSVSIPQGAGQSS